MGLIREPKNVDFTVESKPWTKVELRDFRKLMTELKMKNLPSGKAGAKRKVSRIPKHRDGRGSGLTAGLPAGKVGKKVTA